MHALIFACLCVCFAQNALGQVLGHGNGLGPCPCAGGLGFNGLAPGNLAAGPYPCNLPLNGISMGGLPISGVTPIGYGDVAVAGELPVGGNTAIAGNVPIIGYVMFEGIVPAGGIASVANNCGCNGPIIY